MFVTQFLVAERIRPVIWPTSIDRDCLRAMSQHKSQQYRPPLYNGANGHRGGNGNGAADQQGWDAYRKWLSRVTAQPAHRAPLDSSIYSWKGYNSWAEKVRQTWKSDDSTES